MTDVKILGSVWFSTMQMEKGSIGIVLTDNGHEQRAYIGITRAGNTQKEDEETIATIGGKFPLKQAKELIGK